MGKVSQDGRGATRGGGAAAVAAVAALGNRLPVYVSSVCQESRVCVCVLCVCLLCLYVNTRTQNFMQC